MSKILEKVVYEQILEYLTLHNILDDFQSGFRKRYSTSTALLKVSEDMRMSYLRKEVVLIVSLDYSKAFDTVNHTLFLNKLRQLNFSESVVQWFKSYLSNRSQAVRDQKGNLSKFVNLNCGVAQGSVLGPLCYSLYTFDLSVILKNRCNFHIYADDTQVYISCKPVDLPEAIQIMNFVLEDVFTWSLKHGLKLNPGKTKAMLMGPQSVHTQYDINALPSITINGIDVPFCDELKNLGVIFDRNLNWNKHLSQISQKVYGTLNNLKKFRDTTPESIRLFSYLKV